MTRVAAAIVLALVLFTVRTGEPDRTESMAIGALRAVVSGERAYASLNHGYFDTLECLATPSCVTGPSRALQPFLAPSMVTPMERRGYRFEFLLAEDVDHDLCFALSGGG